MTTHRFYHTDLSGEYVEMDREDATHARKSLRLGVGDPVELFDGAGMVAGGVIEKMGPGMVVKLTDRRTIEPTRPVVEIAAAVPKGTRAEVMVEKLSELGVACWWPLVTRRSVVDPRPGKLKRFDRITIESAKQCGRTHLMRIAQPIPLDQLIQESDHEHRLIADLCENQVQKLHGAGEADSDVSTMDSNPRWLVLIGPEGGWTDEERRLGREAGFVPWRFGPHVLRIETAAIAAAANLFQHTMEPSS